MPQWGRKVWIIILIKLFLIIFVLRVFFFPDFLKRHFRSDIQRGEYILEKLTHNGAGDD